MRNQQDNGNRYQFRLHPAPPITTTTATSIQPRAAASSLVTTETTTLATMATTAAAAATTTLAPPVLEQTLQQKKQTIINKLEEKEQQNSCNTNINTQNCHNTNKQQQQQEQQQHSGNNSNNNHNNNNNNNNKNSNNIDNTNTTTAKCITTASVVLEDSNSNDAPAAANLLHRKQFVPISDICNASFSSASVSGSIQDDVSNSDQCGLTQAGLEEYNIRASSYYDQPVLFHHQKQSSYAQSEGYHSYVSSSDSSSATPFLDRLRQESELLSRQSSHHWSSQNDLSSISCNSVAASPIPLLLTTIDRDINGGSAEIGGGSSSGGVIGGVSTANHHQQHNNSSESTSSTETLKWLGSMSDVSEASHGTGYSAISESVSSSQLIVHSSRVLTPKRHHSESVLYLNDEQQHSPDALQQQQQSPIQMSPSLRETLAHSPTATTRPIPNHRHSPSYPPVHTSLTRHPYQQHQPQQQHIAMPPATAKREVSAADLPNSSLDEAAAESSFTSAATKSTIVIASAAAAPTSVTSADLQNKSSISVTISNSEAVLTISPQSPPPTDSAQPVYSVSSSDLSPSPNVGASSMIVIGDADSINAAAITTTALSIATGAVAASDNATPSAMPLAASSPLAAAMNASSYRSNHRLFPVSTYAEPVHSNTSQFVHHPKAQYSAGLQKPVVPQQQQQQQQQQPPQVLNVTTAAAAAVQQQQPIGQAKYSPSQASPQQQQTWQSVAELINDFERTTDQQPLKYAYIEPSKTHRISNPALKAFQKNAVQSYFERQQHQQHQHQQQHSKDHSQQQKLYQPHSVHHHMQQQQQQQQQQQLMRPHSYQSLASNKETGHQLLRNSLPNTYGSPATCQQQHHQQQLLNSSICGMQASQISSPPKKPEDKRVVHAFAVADSLPLKPASPAPPPPPPRSRSLMPTLLRRSSSASDYGEFRDQYTCAASQEKLQAQSIKNISSSEKLSFNDCGMPPPPPPPRGRTSALPPRRTSSASEYAAAMRDKAMLQQAAALAHQQHHPHQHNNHQPPLPRNNNANHHYYTTASAATMVAPPLPSTDSGWVPERPPKNPNLRVPSPDLPPPPADVDTNLSDEPLPPPPPEILHRQQQHYYDGVPNTSMTGGELLPPKAPSPNRRNSFAGSSTRKSFFSRTATSVASEAPSKVPPMIPKKPTNIELLHLPHPPASVAAHHSNKAHKVLLNGGLQHHQQLRPSPPPPLPQSATKANANRKRPHHPAMISVPPILENTAIVTIKATTIAANSPAMSISKSSTPPPPLMPRSSAFAAINHKQRCNSKASYLPRQSLEKLNNSDPDHGSYKLMLTSNEDLVGNTKTPAYDILAHSNGKIPNNLPDVLPLGAKLQPHPASPSPTSANSSPLRYGSNNSLANTMNSSSIQHQQQQPHQASTCYPMYPMQHRYSTPAMHSSYNSSSSSNNTHVPNYNRSQSFDVHASNNNNSAAATAGTSPTKFMSQSTIDLKKTHHLEPTLEETMCETTAKILSPAQSENNLSSSAGSPSRRNPLKSTTASKPLSPCSAKREFHRLDSAEEQRPDPAVEGRIFRAELVSTTLATSPCTAAHNSHKSITRKDSLRENIEKITQLQSKLMSAHLSDSSSLVSVYGSKPSLSSPIPASKPQATATEEPNATSEQSHTNAAEIKQQQFLENCSRPEHQRCISAEITSNDSFSPPPQTSTITSLPQQQSANEYEQSDDDDNANAEIIATQISQMDSTIDGLKLMQRSELILHVNPNTTEVASQTDDLPDCDMGRLTAVTPQHNKEDSQARYSTTTLQPRQRLPIEVDCDNMFKELASLLSPNDKLIEILIPTIIKSPTDYIANLYNPNVPCRPAKRDVGTSTLMRMHRGGEIRESPERGGGKMITVELQYAEVEVLLTNGSESDGCDLMKKKVDDLIKHLNRKIRILNKEQTMISEEIAFNDELGSNLISKLTDKVRPIEATKFRTYIDDIGHITSLLLSLSERLARSENSLSTITDNSAEKKTLESKRDRLLEQLDEAKRLKEDIDRRGSSVIVMLEKNLSADDFADFDYFINMKAKLIADARDIADKVKCGEEQLNSLSEALIQSDC